MLKSVVIAILFSALPFTQGVLERGEFAELKNRRKVSVLVEDRLARQAMLEELEKSISDGGLDAKVVERPDDAEVVLSYECKCYKDSAGVPLAGSLGTLTVIIRESKTEEANPLSSSSGEVQRWVYRTWMKGACSCGINMDKLRLSQRAHTRRFLERWSELQKQGK